MIKILHFADLHLDAPFSGLNDPQKAMERRNELKGAFLKIVEYVCQNGIRIVLCAGDLFDGKNTTLKTIRYLMDIMNSHREIMFFISPGNHDFVYDRSYYSVMEWPSNVKIFTSGIEKVELKEYGLCVYGAGFTDEFADEPILNNFKVDDPNKINIMVLHGDIGVKGSKYNYISEEMIEKSGLDYLALGHIHMRSEINKRGNTYYAYCGCPEGHGFDELGNKGVYSLAVDKGVVNSEFVPISKRIYLIQNVDISDSRDEYEIIDRIKKILSYNQDNFCRIILKGKTLAQTGPDMTVIGNALKGECYDISLRNETSKTANEAGGDEGSLVSIYQRNMEEKIAKSEDNEREKYLLALKYGLLSLKGEEIDL